jgi:mono/diheme cytochrome c family protein
MRSPALPSLAPLLGLALLAGGLVGEAPAGGDDAARLEHFEARVRPLLLEHCSRCHGEEKQRGGLRLDSVEHLLAGGDSGPVLRAGDPDGSLLVRAIRHEDEDLAMPPRRRLSPEQVADVERWVADGLAVPAGATAAPTGEDFDLEARRAHWSFQPLADPAPPPVRDGAWARDDLDRFLLARLEAEGLAPAPDATPEAWLRRVTFVLTGLPPTPEERAAFLDAPDAAGRERVVDRLLAGAAHAEHFARHWLDLVRYAETRGHEFDFPIPGAFEYRDYLVRAFSADVPHDRLVAEHIAGDLLPTPRPDPRTGADESILGTGFWHLGDGVHSPVDIRADQTDRLAGQVDTLSRAFLGLTVACARCHDHKFDPITAEDYHALCGFALGASYRQVRFEAETRDEELAGRLEELEREHGPLLARALYSALRDELGELPARVEAADRLAAAEPALLAALAPLEVLRPGTLQGPGARARGALRAALADRAGLTPEELMAWRAELVPARSDATHPLHLTLGDGAGQPPAATSPLPLDPSAPVDPRASLDPSPSADPRDPLGLLLQRGPEGGAFLFQNGHAAGSGPLPAGALLLGTDPRRPVLGALTDDAVSFRPLFDRIELAAGHPSDPTSTGSILPGRMVRSATFTLEDGRLSALVRGRGVVFASVDSHRLLAGPLHGATLRHVNTGPGFEWIELDLREYAGHRVHVEFSPARGAEVTFGVGGLVQGPVPARSRRTPVALGDALDRLDGHGQVRVADLALLDWILARPELFSLEHEGYRAAGAAWSAAVEAIAADHPWRSPTAPALLEGNGVDEFVLLRGSASSPTGPAPRRFLEALDGKLAPPITRGSGRLELARAMTAPTNPLTPRVWVNRLWHHVFGRGLVATVDDLGAMGELPTHPALLDRLARDLMDDGWSTRRLLRRLVLSRAFAMSSAGDADAEELDPTNRLLHRMPVRRLEAEALRDAVLAASGSLDRTVGGPSVPIHLTPFLDGRGRPGSSGPLDGARRRSLYQEVRRNFPQPFLTVFDLPNPAATMGRRAESNVPAQALTLLNDPFVHQEAERFARRLLDEVPPERVAEGEAASAPRSAGGSPGHPTAEEAAPRATSDAARPARLERAWLLALSRRPTAEEEAAASGFLDGSGLEPLERWTALCHVLLNMKEFRYLP